MCESKYSNLVHDPFHDRSNCNQWRWLSILGVPRQAYLPSHFMSPFDRYAPVQRAKLELRQGSDLSRIQQWPELNPGGE